MSEPQSPLPDFDNPPVEEVALSVQFEPIEALGTIQLGVLWNEYREQFGKTEQHPPLPPAIESYGVPPSVPERVRFEIMQTMTSSRFWFVNESGTKLIQVQQDRFIQNWRKLKDEDEYPRYKKLRESFRDALDTFKKFLSRENLGEIKTNQWDVTYVNQISAGQGWEHHGQLANVFTVFGTKYSDNFLRDPEEARLAVYYIIPEVDGTPLGRLRITVEPGYRRSDRVPMFVMKNIARGRLEGSDMEEVLRGLDIGHEWIVRGFASITTPEMHRIWRRTDDH